MTKRSPEIDPLINLLQIIGLSSSIQILQPSSPSLWREKKLLKNLNLLNSLFDFREAEELDVSYVYFFEVFFGGLEAFFCLFSGGYGCVVHEVVWVED